MPRFWQTWRERRATEPQAEARARVQDYQILFVGPVGQRVLADICRRAGLMQTSFDGDPYGTAYREGRRRVALEIIETINADPEAVRRAVIGGTTEELFAHDRPDPYG